MHKMQAPVICFLSSTVAITLASYTKKTLIPTSSQNQQTNDQQSLKSSWPFVKKTSTMVKSFKNKLIIKA